MRLTNGSSNEAHSRIIIVEMVWELESMTTNMTKDVALENQS
jgi:hypothetical protein